jgi:hypothetical protein
MSIDCHEYKIAFGRCKRRNTTRYVGGYEKSAVAIRNTPQPRHGSAL